MREECDYLLNDVPHSFPPSRTASYICIIYQQEKTKILEESKGKKALRLVQEKETKKREEKGQIFVDKKVTFFLVAMPSHDYISGE